MRRTKLSALAVLLLAALALTAAGCGGGGSKNSAATTEAATTEAATTEEATTEETTTEAATTEEATTEEATTEEATTTSAIAGLVASGKCKDLANLGQKYSEALSGAGDTQNLKKTAEVVQEFADEAPSEIKDDFKVLADYLTKVADVVGNIKPGQTPDASTLAKLQKLSTEIDAQKLQQAGTNITAWVSKNCKA
jgi:hypothetical protein